MSPFFCLDVFLSLIIFCVKYITHAAMPAPIALVALRVALEARAVHADAPHLDVNVIILLHKLPLLAHLGEGLDGASEL